MTPRQFRSIYGVLNGCQVSTALWLVCNVVWIHIHVPPIIYWYLDRISRDFRICRFQANSSIIDTRRTNEILRSKSSTSSVTGKKFFNNGGMGNGVENEPKQCQDCEYLFIEPVRARLVYSCLSLQTRCTQGRRTTYKVSDVWMKTKTSVLTLPRASLFLFLTWEVKKACNTP